MAAALLWPPGPGWAGFPSLGCGSSITRIAPSHSLGHAWGSAHPVRGRRGRRGRGTPVRRRHPPSPLLPALPRAQVAGVHSQALPDLPDGTFDLDQLELTIREAHGSRYHPRPELICLENTHSSAGGRALPLTYLQQVGASGWQQPCLGVGSRTRQDGTAGTPGPCRGAQSTAHVGASHPTGLGASRGPP